MSVKYARSQAPGFQNRVENIAIVGAGGNVGRYVAEELLKTQKHKVTAITRADSKNKLPEGVTVKHVNYDDPDTLVGALQGQDVLIITMNVMAPPDTQRKLIEAAAKANVPWVLPNEWGADPTQEALKAESYPGNKTSETREYIESLGKSDWIAIVCSFWYEFSLAGSPHRYGFDFKNRSVVFFDEGTRAINTSTWDQCGRALAALLSLKVLPEDENDKTPTLSQFRNNYMYLSSFNVSQKDMFASVLRVTGSSESDWNISYQNTKERYDEGVKMLKEGKREGFAQLMYTRTFYPTDEANYEKRGLLHNDLLGLPKEDFDAATKKAVDLALGDGTPY
ncbi:uncharacterized protein A1O9_02553 [Exophiala aquamarina CBS 119918]|uniref:NmrA-like domain-containing protein n=1 Tax=Exophiala aquamarina CBS 119918 TaxID=1182545 RepID=A0A072PLL7_9EURO|nr:uncharacterized protein A1O9_02553 [Exophiala aquamarina CBS 119918]KEF60989.1 hypothetical protein A1O9_02553 [Exophiala aquamarina CBS 119918]